jgi:hypothetical protein
MPRVLVSAAALLWLVPAGLAQTPAANASLINPLDDIRNTGALSGVYLGGEALDRQAMRAPWTEN